ncbi:MAG: nuclear transport factor 2 family protein [Rhizobiales bacterium]|nr:nuclear transport factor 2 family protein [Hyphomicrobiales bacterium]MBI3702704.1 nuclear transport factor 2 family protein [Hyphomicrobiales bacterium]
MSAEDAVREASGKFYSALNRMANGDARPMADIWSHGAGVSTMHPIGGREIGWEQVQEPWKQVAQLATGGEVRLDKQVIQVVGDAAYELGVEAGNITLAGEKVAIDQRVTNIYRREGNAWKIVHHHTDISAAMLDRLNRLRGRE